MARKKLVDPPEFFVTIVAIEIRVDCVPQLGALS